MDRDHLDPEIVAAWVDGSLDAQSRAQAEAHAADCARCQAVLAAMIRTEPEAVAKPWFSSAAFRWLVPLTAAAAAVAIWVAVTPPKTEAPVPKSAASFERAEPRQVAESAPSRMMSDRSAPAAAPVGQQAAAKRERAAQSPRASEAAERRAGTPAVDQLQPPATGGRAAVPESVTARTSPPPPPAPVSPPPADTRTRAAAEPADARAVVARQMTLSSFAAQRLIQSPDAAVHIRIDAPARIWRSSDAGRTWSEQPSGVTTELTAGSAPSADAVWIVGRAGVVLLSTDRQTWRRVAFPEAVDLTAVTASDARSAVVRTADGRTFSTADGGATWTDR